MRVAYEEAVTAAAEAGVPVAKDKAVRTSGVKLARAAREANRALANRTLVAGRLGMAMALPTHKPKSVQDFMMLDLQEQRRANEAREKLVVAQTNIVSPRGAARVFIGCVAAG